MDVNEFKQVKVNRDYLAEIFSCDVRSITNYVSLYGMPKDERGEYPLFDCLIWFINKQKNENKELAENNPLSVARVKAIELNNLKKQKELEIQENKWLDAELVTLVNITHDKMMMRNLDAIAPRLTKKLNGDAKTLQIIRDELNEFKNICADTPINYYEDEIEKMLVE